MTGESGPRRPLSGERLMITRDDVRRAHGAIGRYLRRTPVIELDLSGPVVLKLEQHRMLRWGSIGEVKANLGGSHLRLARKFEMHIEDQVIARIESPWHALRFNQHRRIGFPK